MVFSASASQPLTQLRSLNLNVRLNEAARDGDRQEARAARLATVTDVKRLYYGIVQTNSALTATEYQARLLEELTRVVSNRVTQQVALKADSLDVETRLARVDLERLTLRNTLASQKERLNSLLGRDVRMDFDVAGAPEATAMTIGLEAAQTRAVAVRPDVAAARVKLRQAELSHRLARAEYVPDVSFAVSYLSPFNIDGAPRVIATAGIQMEWEPFDWGRKGQTSAARAIEVRQARNGVTDAEARAVIEVNSGFRKLDEARAKLRVARLAEDTARENARMRLTQYSVQAALLTDALQAQASLAESTHESQQALLALVVARAEFDQAIGEDGTK
jgi:outer membrane protein TolC